MIDETLIRHNLFNMLKNSNERKRSQTHTYELHNDGRRTHTNWNEFYSGPIRKYTQVDVGGCSNYVNSSLSFKIAIIDKFTQFARMCLMDSLMCM